METRQFQEEFSVEGHFPVNHEFPGMVIRLSWWCVTADGGDGDDSSQVAEAWHFLQGDGRTGTVTERHQICGTCVAFLYHDDNTHIATLFYLKTELLVRYEADQSQFHSRQALLCALVTVRYGFDKAARDLTASPGKNNEWLGDLEADTFPKWWLVIDQWLQRVGEPRYLKVGSSLLETLIVLTSNCTRILQLFGELRSCPMCMVVNETRRGKQLGGNQVVAVFWYVWYR